MDFNLKLIELVRNHKTIYDPNSGTKSKNLAWKEIAKKLQVQERECKKSWFLLREGFRRVLKKQIASESNAMKKAKSTDKWMYEDELAFLIPCMKYSGSSMNNYSNVKENSLNIDNASTSNPELGLNSSLLKRNRTHETGSHRSCSHGRSSNHANRYLLNKKRKRDDVQLFFDSISATVQSFSPHDRAVAKARVFQVISQMEFEILSRDSTSSFDFEGSPSPYDMQSPASSNDLYSKPPPEALSSALLEPNNSFINKADTKEFGIKVEPEEILGLNIKQEP